MPTGPLLAFHVAAGTTALISGACGYAAHRRDAPVAAALGRLYLGAVLAVGGTAFGLVARDPSGLWWLVPLALLTAGLALLGASARGRPRGAGGLRAEAHGWGGSYIALVTATLVVSVSSNVLIWTLPTIVGTVLIERFVARTRAAAGTGGLASSA